MMVVKEKKLGLETRGHEQNPRQSKQELNTFCSIRKLKKNAQKAQICVRHNRSRKYTQRNL